MTAPDSPSRENLYLLREDTITAVSTPPGRGAIGIVRLSGPNAIRAAASVWHGSDLTRSTPRELQHGTLVASDQALLDEALAAVFHNPKSYTGEDLVEFHCHGNPIILSRLIRELVNHGCRPAEPGEFTARAFRNGRLSLLQAEAVGQLIEARNHWVQDKALTALAEDGESWLKQLIEDLEGVWVAVEADLEFPTEGLDDLDTDSLIPLIESLERETLNLTRRSVDFSKLQEGYRVVLAGPPNAGKSSLLNALLGYHRALVTEIPGTTRDSVEETMELGGIPVRLIDTAGLGEARDQLDAAGMSRTRDLLKTADLVVRLSEVEEAPDAQDSLLANLPGTPVLRIGSKVDLRPEWLASKPDRFDLVVSTITGTGLEELRAQIGHTLAGATAENLAERLMLNQRQTQSLNEFTQSLHSALANLKTGAPLELVAEDLAEGRRQLEDLSGKTLRPDLLGSIFSRFCIGK